uniref:Putative secreted protein n=1 Tax=Anopheles darlingi TaxID=43151 RepID=A0A2M4DN34_ANODA
MPPRLVAWPMAPSCVRARSCVCVCCIDETTGKTYVCVVHWGSGIRFHRGFACCNATNDERRTGLRWILPPS